MEFPDYTELQRVPHFDWNIQWFTETLDMIKSDTTKLNRIYAIILHYFMLNRSSRAKTKINIPYGGKSLHGGRGIHFGPNNTIPSDLARLICAYLHTVTDS